MQLGRTAKPQSRCRSREEIRTVAGDSVAGLPDHGVFGDCLHSANKTSGSRSVNRGWGFQPQHSGAAAGSPCHGIFSQPRSEISRHALASGSRGNRGLTPSTLEPKRARTAGVPPASFPQSVAGGTPAFRPRMRIPTRPRDSAWDLPAQRKPVSTSPASKHRFVCEIRGPPQKGGPI